MSSHPIPSKIVTAIFDSADKHLLAKGERLSKHMQSTLTRPGSTSPWRQACLRDFGYEKTDLLIRARPDGNYKRVYAQLTYDKMSENFKRCKYDGEELFYRRHNPPEMSPQMEIYLTNNQAAQEELEAQAVAAKLFKFQSLLNT